MSKTISIKILLTVIILWTSYQSSSAQRNPILDDFSIYKKDGKVFLNWIIASGITCDGIQIFRSADSTNFIQIGSIDGICGSSSSPIPYDFTDVNPLKNSFNYYRLELGNYGYSGIIYIEIIDFESGGFQIRPNPITTDAKIYFENKNRQECNLKIYNISGIEIFFAKTNEEFFQFNSTLLKSGIYLFTISYSGNLQITQGKLIVQH